MSGKICFITGSRAEYGLLKPLMEEIKKDEELNLQLIVTGTHLSYEFGLTYKEIEKDGFVIDEKIEIILSSDTPVSVSKAMGLGMISLPEVYGRLAPEIIIVLGDRFEIFSAVAAAHICRIPVGHLHGGEITEGAFDDALRHSMTKMSYLHFTSTEIYRNRVIQLGEHPDRVFNVGAIGLDNIKNLELLVKEEIENDLNFKFNRNSLLCTFHPVTLEKNTSIEQFNDLIEVLDGLKNTTIIFTKTNADTDGRVINNMIDKYVVANSRKAVSFTSMGQLRYLSTMQYVDAVVGNTSSGIIEAPSFRIGTINIGDRQKGRVKAKSVIDCESTKKGIRNAFDRLYSSDFKKTLKNIVNPHGDGNTAKRIKNILKTYSFDQTIKKSFYDINISLNG